MARSGALASSTRTSYSLSVNPCFATSCALSSRVSAAWAPSSRPRASIEGDGFVVKYCAVKFLWYICLTKQVYPTLTPKEELDNDHGTSRDDHPHRRLEIGPRPLARRLFRQAHGRGHLPRQLRGFRRHAREPGRRPQPVRGRAHGERPGCR